MFRRRRSVPSNVERRSTLALGYDPTADVRDRSIVWNTSLTLTGVDQRDRRHPACAMFTGRTPPLQVFAGVASVGNANNQRLEPQTTTKSVYSGTPSAILDRMEALRVKYGDRLGRSGGSPIGEPLELILERWRS